MVKGLCAVVFGEDAQHELRHAGRGGDVGGQRHEVASEPGASERRRQVDLVDVEHGDRGVRVGDELEGEEAVGGRGVG